MAQPGQGPGAAVNQPEIIENIKCLATDLFALTGNQITLAYGNCGYALLGDQRLDAVLAEAGICAQVGLALK